MLTYEDVWADLLDALETEKLDVLEFQHFVETASCLREFRCTVQWPGAVNGPEIRAEVAFVWDALMTAHSLYGLPTPTETTGVSRGVFPTVMGSAIAGDRDELPPSMLELEIKYYFPTKDFQSAGFVTRAVQGIIMGIIDHHNFPEVNFEISVATDQQVTIHRAYAFYRWRLHLNKDHLDTMGLCREIARVLQALAHSEYFKESY
ncbi:hypothetical protein [Heliophilum fasciatum]|uniref:Uncharacterized protein n=1 Tax=Heliophilum fasciatum TaxID=35700 RepID=A0A4V2SXR5_9FIRM|nr:hypothetical protein [Heliophilum fasciatum]MCW2277420.1 hypothetical protein [Heliophilum fasciatum]TCP67256.1 hypothetical protein EDD73_105154 [Heliophilum fasciatum]